MTGRELIMYILENNLENERVFKDGKMIGLITISEAAVKFDVGESTIKAWVHTGFIKSVILGEVVYIFDFEEDPRLKFKN